MDLYSILGHQLSVDQALPPETAPAAAALPMRAQPPDAASDAASHDALQDVALQNSEEYALAVRLMNAAKLSAILDSTVERVRYITNAGGVALALCENEDDAMVCRASSGPSAPEVGSRMYIRSGITAESLRTRQTLRCDRASTDPRVNQESCKALGIESVMVFPLILERNVVGMFQLFSSKPSAFAERDAKTIQASVPQVDSALREAVVAGMPLGRIPWAEVPVEAPVEIPAVATPLTEAYAGELGPENMDSAPYPENANSVTIKVPVAFPIDAFRKSATAHTESISGDEQPEPSQDPQDQQVPAFLARLADEARPASNRGWSQWFRPQW